MSSTALPKPRAARALRTRLALALLGGSLALLAATFWATAFAGPHVPAGRRPRFGKVGRCAGDVDDWLLNLLGGGGQEEEEVEGDVKVPWQRSGAGADVSHIRRALDDGDVSEALQMFADWEGWYDGSEFPLDLHGELLAILGAAGQLKPAVGHIKELIGKEHVSPPRATELFNSLLDGLLEPELSTPHVAAVAQQVAKLRLRKGRERPDFVGQASLVTTAMEELGALPNVETLRLIIQAHNKEGAPGFAIKVAELSLDYMRRFKLEANGAVFLAVSNCHLRAGDVDASYRWFLASQLCREPAKLSGSAAVMELVSQLARALALQGAATRLLRVLQRVVLAEGELPPSAGSLALKGFTAGRSLATVWLEPSYEFLRRRSIYCSNVKHFSNAAKELTVRCAEQFAWEDQDAARHGAREWGPYLPPDTKLERGWLSPLREEDRSCLGLCRDWYGEGIAFTAARERLRDPSVDSDDKNQHAEELGGAFLFPEHASWRTYHADRVKRSFATTSRTTPKSPEDLREVLLLEVETREWLGGKPKASLLDPTDVQEAVEALLPSQRRQFVTAALDAKSKGNAKGKVGKFIEVLKSIGLVFKDEKSAPTKMAVLEVLDWAIAYATGERVDRIVSPETFRATIEAMSTEELERIFARERLRPEQSLLAGTLADAVDAELYKEDKADQELEGSAMDELQLAISILDELRKVGLQPSQADLRAALQAAYSIGNAEAADKLLAQLTSELREHSKLVLQEELGPAGTRMAEAMDAGGWDRSSAEEFIKGERLLARRQGSGLGRYQTRYVDPLQGWGNDGKEMDMEQRQQALALLTTPYSPSQEVGHVPLDITFKNDDLENQTMTAREVVARLERRYEIASDVFSMSFEAPKKLTESGAASFLELLGFPVPGNRAEVMKLYDYVQSVFRKSQTTAASRKR